MNYLVVKLYINDIQGDYHDIMVNKWESLMNEMIDYANANGKKMYFASLTTDQFIGLPIDCTPFAEIEYTGNINDDEKKQYIEYVRKFSMSAQIKGKNLEEVNTLKMVKFRKIDDEIYEIS